MVKRRMLTLLGGTVICALAIGFMMQKLDSARSGEPAAAPDTGTAPGAIQQSVLPPAMPPARPAPEPLPLEAITHTSTQPEPQRPAPKPLPALAPKDAAPDAPRAAGAGDCPVAAQARPAPMASVRLVVSAPCLPNERVTLHHHGMIFTAVTDAAGRLDLSVPALAERAVFIAAFANGKGAVATAEVPDLADYDRVVVQWSGAGGFQIHAREFGAGYGEPGHVWHGAAPRGDGAGGMVQRLGDAGTLAPQLAEIYSFPRAAADSGGQIALSVEAEVSAANCGRDVAAQLLELRGPGARLRTRDLVLSVPNCTAIGDFLVLNNIVDDLKIAAR